MSSRSSSTFSDSMSRVREATPPPYSEDPLGHPAFIAQTMTTTTTTTTTHFVPLFWRSRKQAPGEDDSSAVDAPHTDTAAVVAGSTHAQLHLNKDLPKTPSISSLDSVFATQHEIPRGARVISVHAPITITPSSPGPTPSRLKPRPDRPLVALAQAGLGLGFPRQNTVLSPDSPPARQPPAFTEQRKPERVTSSSVIRKARSFSREVKPSESTHFAERRQRRMSVGEAIFASLGIGSTQEARVKVPEQFPEQLLTLPPTPPIPLQRKSSFWPRRRVSTLQVSIQPNPEHMASPTTFVPAPSLPAVRPSSPLDLEHSLSLSSASSTLRRRSTYSASLRPSPTLALFNSPSHETEVSPAPSLPSTPAALPSHIRQPCNIDVDTPYISSSFLVDSSPRSPVAPASPLRLRAEPPTLDLPTRSRPFRPRSTTNPPLLRRISQSFFHSPPFIPSSSSVSTAASASTLASATPSPRPSFSKAVVSAHEDETPEIYVKRLVETVSKAEVANVLASSGGTFHGQALTAYMSRFDFSHDPLDVALRKLLMDTALPRETQQIDRVMEAFAARYLACNPGLFHNPDHPYILAFSLMMLHTDAFNKSNKNKMSKADYVKNTRLPGVAPETLEYFFDNIRFSPFIFIEDPVDVNGARMFPAVANGTSSPQVGTASILGRSNKVDPYLLITQNLLQPLRVELSSIIPFEDPFSYLGTGGAWNLIQLRRAFAQPDIIEIEDKDVSSRRRSIVLGQFSAVTVVGVMPSIQPTPMLVNDSRVDEPWPQELLTLRVTKVGLLGRKDEVLDGGRRAGNRKWKDWSVILTGSQLLFFRDPGMALGMLSIGTASGQQVLIPQMDTIKPDEIISLYDSIALFDSSYKKYAHAFRLVMPKGRQLILRSTGAAELNEWLSRINYASSFKTAGVRMRQLGLSGQEIEGAGIAAATSHLRESHMPSPSNRPPVRSWTTEGDFDKALIAMNTPPPESSSPSRSTARRKPRTSFGGAGALDVEDYVTSTLDVSDQFKAAFDEVKAELSGQHVSRPAFQRANSHDSTYASDDMSRSASRSELMLSKARDLESKINTARLHLESELRIAKNLAVLTPFQRATRERIQLAASVLAKRIALVRMDLAKMSCHREVLCDDLADEAREWQRTKRQVLKVATQAIGNSVPSLHALTESPSPSPDLFATNSVFWPVPSLMSPHTQNGVATVPPCIDTSPLPPSTPAEPSPPRHSTSPSPVTPIPSDPPSVLDPVPHDLAANHLPLEECEQWDRTRAAKRVSLVKLPLDKLTVMFDTHVRQISEAAEPPEGFPSQRPS